MRPVKLEAISSPPSRTRKGLRLALAAGLAWDVSDDVSLGASYEGLFAKDQHTHSGALRLSVRF